MSLTATQLYNSLILCKAGTLGGPTYWVDGNPTCLAHCKDRNVNSGNRCSQPAGKATDHPDTGRCKWHAGRSNPVVLTGRYSTATSRKLNLLYEQYAADPDLLDLMPELALLRALLGNFLEYYQDVNLADEDYRQELRVVLHLIEQVSRQSERIQRIDRDQTLTLATAKLIMVRAVDVATRFVPPEHMEKFVRAWRREVLEPITLTNYMVQEEQR